MFNFGGGAKHLSDNGSHLINAKEPIAVIFSESLESEWNLHITSRWDIFMKVEVYEIKNGLLFHWSI